MPLWFCDFNCGGISFYEGHQKSRYSLNQIDINTMAMSMMIIIKILIKWVWSKPVAMQSASKACSTEDVVELSIFFVLSLSPQAWALHIFPVFNFPLWEFPSQVEPPFPVLNWHFQICDCSLSVFWLGVSLFTFAVVLIEKLKMSLSLSQFAKFFLSQFHLCWCL